MRHLFQYEKRNQPLASPQTFSSRLARNGLWALGVITVSMVIGVAGYMGFERLGFIDAFVNAAMILSGMGPVQPLQNDGAKVFAAFYAIASGLLLFAIAGLILAPVYHRILHRFHVPETDRPDRRESAAHKVASSKPAKRKR